MTVPIQLLRRAQKCSSFELAVASLVIVLTALVLGSAMRSSYLYAPLETGSESELLMVNITIVSDAVKQGAVCLDGSPPAYHLHRGSGTGSRNWIVFLEGGGWCSSNASCAERSRTRLGSSRFMEPLIGFGGILSNSADENPDFYDWNRVKVRYCDGASYAGDVDGSVPFHDQTLRYRGQKVWRAVIRDLLGKGMDQASKALLSGCSAGGLASILHCDNFRALLPRGATVKCLSDGGFFQDVKDVAGAFTLRSFYKHVMNLQNVERSIPEACTSEYGAKCLFPEYILPHVQTPLFVLNSGYDAWQVMNVFVPDIADPGLEWESCKRRGLSYCSNWQLSVLEDYRAKLLESLAYARNKDGWALFVDSCFVHCQTEKADTWARTIVGGKTIRDAVGDWYFNRNQVKEIDCAYPCNPTCVSWAGWGH